VGPRAGLDVVEERNNSWPDYSVVQHGNSTQAAVDYTNKVFELPAEHSLVTSGRPATCTDILIEVKCKSGFKPFGISCLTS
jgi:hypothetical protein